jgi:hypothetical protein
MNKIFIHVKENHFKLNEDVDRSVSKMEEGMGLNYIRKVLIPLAVGSWNRACSRSKTYKNCVITKELISQNLKKVGHDRHSKADGTTTDVIRYKSNFLLPGNLELKEPFEFEIYKAINNGKLTATFMIPGGDIRHYYVGETLD